MGAGVSRQQVGSTNSTAHVSGSLPVFIDSSDIGSPSLMYLHRKHKTNTCACLVSRRHQLVDILRKLSGSHPCAGERETTPRD